MQGCGDTAAGGELDEQGLLDVSNQDSSRSLNLAIHPHTRFSRRNRLIRYETQSHGCWERPCRCLNSPRCPRDCISQPWWNAAQGSPTPPLHSVSVASNEGVLSLPQVTHPPQAGESSGWRHLYLGTAGLTAEETWRPQATSKLQSPSHTGHSLPFSLHRGWHLVGTQSNIILLQGRISTCQRPSLTSMGRMYRRAREELVWQSNVFPACGASLPPLCIPPRLLCCRWPWPRASPQGPGASLHVWAG